MSQTPHDDDQWCRRYRPAGNPTARLVCLPHAGGSAAFYLPVSVALSPGVDVVALQYPGRQDRRAETPIDDMSVLADRVHAIVRRQPELPLILFGHSMGAVLGFEVTRRLEADGGSAPVHLFTSGRRGPATYRNETIHLRDDAGIIAEVRKMSGTASSVLGDDEIMRAALPALRADYKATETYSCPAETTVSCPITALVGDNDPKTTVEEARAWGTHTTGEFDLKVFNGGHFFITDHAAEIIKLLAAHLRPQRIQTTA